MQYVYGFVNVKIKDISLSITSGGTPNTNITTYYGGDIPWLRTQEIDFNIIDQTSMTITQEGMDNSSAKWINKNCVIVAMYGATVGKVAVNNIPLTTNQACCNIELNSVVANYKYVYYCLANQYEYIKSLGQGSQTNINAQIVKELEILLPSLERQGKIVSILDKFEAIINDLSNGLPAEIEARQKQYKFYRDKLLNFKRKN